MNKKQPPRQKTNKQNQTKKKQYKKCNPEYTMNMIP